MEQETKLQQQARLILAVYATIEGNKLKNAYEIGERLTKACLVGKEHYKALTTALLKSNLVEKSTFDKYRKVYAKLNPFQHANNKFNDNLKEITSFTVVFNLTALDKIKFAELMEGSATTYKTFISELTSETALQFVELITKEGMTVTEAIATLPKYEAYKAELAKKLQEQSIATQEEGEQEEQTQEATAEATALKALRLILGDSFTVTGKTAEEIAEAMKVELMKAIKPEQPEPQPQEVTA
jgi:hypothetical protein